MLEKATTLKRFKYSLLSKSLEKQTNVIKQTEFNNEKKDVRGKLLKIIIGTVVKNWENAENAIFFPKKQGHQYVGMDKIWKTKC